MAIHICTAPCCWGVDDIKNPYLPPWQRILGEAAEAGYRGIELGPYGYLPLEAETLSPALSEHGLHIVAGTIFDDLVSPANCRSCYARPTPFADCSNSCRPSNRNPANASVALTW